MLEEITVVVDDAPGALAELGEILGREGVNIATLCATAYNGRGVVHLVCEDGEDAAAVLAEQGYKIEARPVLSVTLDDAPGELGKYCRKLEAAGVAISSAYVARRGQGESELIVAVDNLEAAKQA